jgi:hypothetical protein
LGSVSGPDLQQFAEFAPAPGEAARGEPRPRRATPRSSLIDAVQGTGAFDTNGIH